MAFPNENGNRYNMHYTADEAQMVDKAKRVHRETTESANRALKTAERTRELAANTLGELQHQGQKLDVIDRDLHDIDQDVEESRTILSYMRRCCLCFLCSCCCDGDRDVVRDSTRKMRVKMRNQVREQEKEAYAKAQELSRADTSAGTAASKTPVNEEVARNELFEKPGRVNIEERRRQRAAARNPAYRIGENLADEDREEIQAETHKQEETFDQIGAALGDLKEMSHAMNDELKRQEKVLDNVTDHTERTGADLYAVSTQAKRDFKVRPKPSSSGGIRRQALRAATRFV